MRWTFKPVYGEKFERMELKDVKFHPITMTYPTRRTVYVIME